MSLEVVKIREFKGHSQAVYALCLEPNGNRIFSGAGDGMIVVWNRVDDDGKLVIRHNSAVYALYCDESYLFSGTRSGLFSVFGLDGYGLIRHLQLGDAPIFEIIRIGLDVLVLSGDGCLYVLDGNFELKSKLNVSSKSLRCIRYLNDSIAIGASDGGIYILNRELQPQSTIHSHSSSVFALAYEVHSGNLLSGGRDAIIRIHKNTDLLKEIPAHLLHIHRLEFSPEYKMLASSSMDKTIKIWGLNPADDGGMEYRLMKVIDAERYGGHTSSVNKILWIDKNTIISCSDDRTLKCFEILEK